MNTSTRLLAVLPIVALAVATGLSAQSKPLAASEVSQLISRGDSADHARLSAHFAALVNPDNPGITESFVSELQSGFGDWVENRSCHRQYE